MNARHRLPNSRGSVSAGKRAIDMNRAHHQAGFGDANATA